MAFIVEDGTIVEDANAYITVAELKAYWLNRNDPLYDPDGNLQAAIIIASQYVDLNNTWRGYIREDVQTLDWPRSEVIDDEGRRLSESAIPKALKNAICEYAKRQITSQIQPDVDTDTGAIIMKKEKVDVIEQEIQYQEDSTGYYGIKRFPLADKWLRGLTTGGVNGGFGTLRRC